MKPFIKWAGGKRWLADHGIFSEITNARRYFEPFFGGGALYFHLLPSRAVVSDINSRLIEAYVGVRDNPMEVRRLLQHHQNRHSSSYYYEIRRSHYESTVEKAAQFLYLNRTCWNGLYRENRLGEFNVPIGTKSQIFDPNEDFIKISEALKRAEIHACDFEEIIDTAGEGDFVFCDPPYTTAHNNNGFIKYNQNIFSWDDQIRLRDAAVKAAERGATVFVTNADHPSLHDLYQSANKIDKVQRSSVISGNSKGRGVTTEILVTV